MPYKVEADTTLPRVIASGRDPEGNEYRETESASYSEGQVVYEEDLAPDIVERLEGGDEHLSNLLTHISDDEAEKLRAAAAAGEPIAPEHEAEAEVLRQDGKEVLTRDEIVGANVTEDGPGSDLEGLTKAELSDRAQELGVEGYSSLNKAELLNAVREAEHGDDEDEEGEEG